MHIESFRNYCLQKKASNESFPFDHSTLVMKVMNKIFAVTDTEDDFKISLICTPEKVQELCELYPSIIPAPHFNKKHWICIQVNEELSDAFMKNLIDESYRLVVSKLTRAEREKLRNT